MGPILSIAIKDLRMLLRDRAAAFFTFVFPLLLAIFFGFVFGGGGGGGGALELGVVDEDRGAASQKFVSDLSKADGLTTIVVESREKASEMIRQGKLSIAVVFPKGFGEGAGGMFSGEGMKIEGLASPGASAQTGLLTGRLMELGFRQMIGTFSEPSALASQLDRARKSIADSPEMSAARKSSFMSFFGSLESFSGEIDAQGKAGSADGTAGGGAGEDSALGGWKPVDVTFSVLERKNTPLSSFEISFPQGVVWGLMGCTLAFGISLAEERARGTLTRLTTSPLSRSQILLGKAAGCFIACTLVQVMLVAMAMLPFFGVHVSNVGAMIAGILLCSTGFSGVMMLLAGLSKTESAAQGVGRAVMLVLALIGGGSVPLFILPKGIQLASGISPFRWATLLIEGGLWRDFGPMDMLLPGGIMLGIGVVGYAVGSATFRWQE